MLKFCSHFAHRFSNQRARSVRLWSCIDCRRLIIGHFAKPLPPVTDSFGKLKSCFKLSLSPRIDGDGWSRPKASLPPTQVRWCATGMDDRSHSPYDREENAGFSIGAGFRRETWMMIPKRPRQFCCGSGTSLDLVKSKEVMRETRGLSDNPRPPFFADAFEPQWAKLYLLAHRPRKQ